MWGVVELLFVSGTRSRRSCPRLDSTTLVEPTPGVIIVFFFVHLLLSLSLLLLLLMVVGVFEQSMLVIVLYDGEGVLGHLEALHLCNQGGC